MTSGKVVTVKATKLAAHKLVIAALLLLFANLGAAAEWTVSDLMHLLAQTKSDKASFVEKTYLGIIDKPLVSSGELTFTAPDRLEKRTLKPKPELLQLEGNRLVVEQANKRRVFRLDDHPEIGAFVESMRGTLAGDRHTLERYYRLDLSGTADKWQLVLVPIEKRMRAVINRIQITGAHAEIESIDFEQADGDRSEMTIFHTSPP